MEFFGMGAMEILVVLVVGLIAFGPGKLPQLARNLGKGMAAFRKVTRELTEEMSREFQELEKQGKELSTDFQELKKQGKDLFKEEEAAKPGSSEGEERGQPR